VTRREAGGCRGAQATAGRKRQEHEDDDEVEGKRRVGEAKRAARPAIAAAGAAARASGGRGFD
jgi:hypothetical protein